LLSSFTVPSDLAARLDPVDAPNPDPGPLQAAAVIALLWPDGLRCSHDDPRLILIERSRLLRAHAGQLAFPGGKPEPGDTSLLATALREAEEEVAVLPSQIQILGRLPTVSTPSGFMIVPFVAWADATSRPTVASSEVHRVLSPRLADLAKPGVHRRITVQTPMGGRRSTHCFDIGEPPLWGATAQMVWELIERMRGQS